MGGEIERDCPVAVRPGAPAKSACAAHAVAAPSAAVLTNSRRDICASLDFEFGFIGFVPLAIFSAPG
jgi:hypothetical protein